MRRRDFLKWSVGVFVGLLAFNFALRGREPLVLNSTGYRVLTLHRKGLSPEKIADILTKEYEVDYETAYRDVVEFLKEVRNLSL